MLCQVIRSYIVSSCCLSSDHVNSTFCQFMLSVHFVRPSCPVKLSVYVGISYCHFKLLGRIMSGHVVGHAVRSGCQVLLSGYVIRSFCQVMLSTSIHVKLLLIQSLHSSPETPIKNVPNPCLSKFQGFNESLRKGSMCPL